MYLLSKLVIYFPLPAMLSLICKGQPIFASRSTRFPTFVLGPVSTSKTFSQGSWSIWSWRQNHRKIHENARGVKTRHKFFGKRMVKIACRMVCTLENTHTLLGTNIFPTSRHFWVDDFPFPQVGYVSFVEGTTCFSQNPPIHLSFFFFWGGGFTFAGFSLWALIPEYPGIFFVCG